MRKALFTEFMMQAPFQPATNYWRSVEIDEVIRYGIPIGCGLDLGCGDGHLMAIILGNVGPRDLVGVDIDPQETTLARRRHIYREVVTTPGDHLPFCDNQFDFVFSNSVLEHIHNIENTLAEVARVLRPGGRFIFTVPSEDFHKCLKGPGAGADRESYLREVDSRCYHLRYWNAGQWSTKLKDAGLDLAHESKFLNMAEVQRWESIARNTSGLLYRLFGKTKQPIEIQRQMRMRTPSLRFPRVLARFFAEFLGMGKMPSGPSYGCSLLEAHK